MKAIDIEKEKLVLKDIKDPVTNPGEILIKTTATAINRADLVQRSGLYHPPPGASPILGLECAGEVIGLGEGVEGFEEGQKVCALLTGGGYAEKVAVSEGQVLPIPSNFDTILSAAIPEVFGTAFLNLYMEANLVPNERVLLHAGASGVGTAAIQLCKAFGNPCFVTAGNLEKIKFCKNLGADDGSIRTKESFLKKALEWNGDSGVDVILDPVGANYLSNNLKVLKIDGRLALIGLMGGSECEIDLGQVLMKRIKIIGSTLRARSVHFKTHLMQELLKKVWPLFETNKIEPIIDKTFRLSEAEEAHEYVASNQSIGKVLLTVD